MLFVCATCFLSSPDFSVMLWSKLTIVGGFFVSVDGATKLDCHPYQQIVMGPKKLNNIQQYAKETHSLFY